MQIYGVAFNACNRKASLSLYVLRYTCTACPEIPSKQDADTHPRGHTLRLTDRKLGLTTCHKRIFTEQR